jgi:hypothetical protein
LTEPPVHNASSPPFLASAYKPLSAPIRSGAVTVAGTLFSGAVSAFSVTGRQRAKNKKKPYGTIP